MEYLKLIPINLKNRSLRTWLTLLGVVMGVIAIVLLVGLGDGLNASISDQLNQFGAQNIVIFPGSTFRPGAGSYLPKQGKLYLTDIDRIKRVPGVDFTAKAITVPRQSLDYKGQEMSIGPVGFEAEIFLSNVVPQYKIARGRFYRDNERNVAILGHDLAYNTFDQNINVGSNIYVGGKRYKVIGILEKIGQAGGAPGNDRAVIINYIDARDIVDEAGLIGKNEVTAIYVRVSDGFDTKEVSERIAFELRSAHKVRENDFTLMTADFLKEQVNTILSILTIFLGVVASISLVVSAVGVSNTMFTAVLERTREIGIMKSLGAKNSHILNMFLTESAFLCATGGIIGLVSSFIFVIVFNQLSVVFEFGIFIVVSIWLVLGAFLFSLLIGIFAGVFPAWKASKLDPVVALRS
ncbi:ABC transporter permease [Candidatus Micrarchaeota archaeon]|nr:ABC transporter permease [Candidatus Micrarchaeota archaeon]